MKRQKELRGRPNREEVKRRANKQKAVERRKQKKLNGTQWMKVMKVKEEPIITRPRFTLPDLKKGASEESEGG